VAGGDEAAGAHGGSEEGFEEGHDEERREEREEERAPRRAMMAQSERALSFHRLHAPGQIVILPNAWDAGTARLIETAGAKAIATSSAAVAWASGYPDGNALPPAVLRRSIELIVRAIKVPLSVDSEGGYSDDPAAVGENLGAFIDAGAVGVNLEDGTGGPELLCAKIEAARRSSERAGIRLFINARVDALLRKLVPREQAIDETIARARRYIAAGCDGIFVPMLSDRKEIETVVRAIDPVPLNVMAVPGLPAAGELRSLGVRRLSAGASIGKASMTLTGTLAADFLRDGDSDAIHRHVGDLTLNGLFGRE
jgi:2-methylisocitrate lyase-like PEP mutase family enzyme